MQHRDEIILRKVISEINIVHDMLGMTTLEEFVNDEKLKRAVSISGWLENWFRDLVRICFARSVFVPF